MQQSVGPIDLHNAPPPPPDGSGVVPVAAQQADNTPPPPDGSGIAPGATEVGDEQQGGFADQLPPQVATRLAPEDQAHLVGLYKTASANDIARFLESKGFSSDPVALAHYVAGRDHARQTGGQVNYGVTYDLPKATDGTAAGAAARGAAQGATLGFSDELHGIGTGALAALRGGSFGDAYDRTVDQDRAQIGYDEANHGIASLAGNLAGGIALPFGLEKTGITTSIRALGVATRDAAIAEGIAPATADRLAARAITHRLATEGAAYGGGYGVGSNNGDSGQRLVAGAEGAGLGALTGGVAGRVGEGLAARAAARPVDTTAQDVAAAADRQGIDVLPADVGGPATRRLTAAAAQAPLSASPIIKAAQTMSDQAQSARDRIASAVGQALDPEGAGLSVRTGAQKYIASSGQDVRNAYRVAEAAAGDARVTPGKALDTLDRNIAELSETPGGAPGLDRMQGLRDELAKGDVTPAGLLRMRTTLRDQFMQDGLRGSDTERRIGQVLDAAGQDVTDGLNAAGKEGAASAYARAAAMYKTRIDTIDNVLTPIIGSKDAPRSGEQVTKSLIADLQGNNARAVKLMRALPAEDQATARASIIGSLGQATAGRQNAEGTAFSLSQFLTQWNKVGGTAKRALFDPETRSALDDLAKVADATKEAQRYSNFSNTSGGIWGNLGVLAAGATAAPHATAIGAATQLIGGRLLASPRFARWLARAPKTSLGAPAYIERLGRIAKAEPAIAPQLLQLQDHLTQQQAANQ